MNHQAVPSVHNFGKIHCYFLPDNILIDFSRLSAVVAVKIDAHLVKLFSVTAESLAGKLATKGFSLKIAISLRVIALQ